LKRAYTIYVLVSVSVFAVVNYLNGMLNDLIYWGTQGVFLGRGNTLLPLTYGMAWASVVIMSVVLRRRGLKWIAASFYAFTVAFLWVVVFETLWQNSFLIFGIGNSLINQVALASWLVLGMVSWRYWTVGGNRLFLIQLIAYGVLWLFWIGVGYPQMPDLRGTVLNVTLKVLSFSMILSLFRTQQRREETRRGPPPIWCGKLIRDENPPTFLQ
jgi:hypothetical protein